MDTLKNFEDNFLNHKPVTTPDVIPIMTDEFYALIGIAGIPRGKIIQITCENAGEIFFLANLIQQAQAKNHVLCLIDVECNIDMGYLKKFDIHLGELMLAQPTTSQQCLSILEHLYKFDLADFVILSSTLGLFPTETEEAKKFFERVKEIKNLATQSTMTVIIVNPSHVHSNTINNISDVQLKLVRGHSIRKNEELIGREILAQTTKNSINLHLGVTTFMNRY